MVKRCSLLSRRIYPTALSILNDETRRLTRELTQLTGESMSAAVLEAVRERPDRVRAERGSGLAERLMRIAKESAVHLQKPFSWLDHGELFYNERGYRGDY